MDLGPATLRPRHQIHTAAAVAWALGIAATVTAWVMLDSYRVFVTVILTLFMVLTPAWVVWTHATQRIVVHPDRIEVRGPRGVRRTLAYANLREVLPMHVGKASHTGASSLVRAVQLSGTTTKGRRSLLRMSTAMQESIAPVLLALAPVVEARPDLLPHSEAETLFGLFLADAQAEAR